MPQDWFAQNAPKAAPVAPSGDWFAQNAPKESTSVTLDYGDGQRTFVDSAIDFARGIGNIVNPLPALKTLYADFEAHLQDNADKLGIKNPILKRAGSFPAMTQTLVDTALGLGKAQFEQFKKGYVAYKQGRYSEAVGHTLAGAAPLFGPVAANTGEKIAAGKVAEGFGEATGLLLPFGADFIGSKLKPVGFKGTGPNPNPVEASAVQFGLKEGIPIDAATATGNKAVAGLQQAAEHSPVGSIVSQIRRRQQVEALTHTGNVLADRTYPTPVVPEQAGEGVRTALNTKIGAIKKFEDQAYSKFRDIANDPANLKEVEVGQQSSTMKAHFDEVADQAATEQMQSWADSAKTTREFQRNAKEGPARGMNDSQAVNAEGKAIDETAQANARRIQTSGTKEGSPLADFKEPPAMLVQAIQQGKGKLFERIKEAYRDSVIETYGEEIRQSLRDAGVQDKGAGIARVPILKKMALPVDMRPVKTQLKPLYEQMSQWMEPAKRNASAGFQAVKSIVEGPNHLPAEIAEKGLGGLKALAREAVSADLRDVNAGLGANAAKLLQNSIDQTVSGVGPHAIDALKAGRMAHKAKMEVADALESLHKEPVQAFGQTVWAKDAGIERLRNVAKHAPKEMPKIGRAFLDDLLGKATREGGFDKTVGVLAKWDNLGPQTKRILYQDPQLVKDLDNFFLLAKKIAERPNPSGSGVVGGLIAGVGYAIRHPLKGGMMLIPSGPLAAMLHSEKGVRLLTNGMKVSIGNKPAAILAADELLKLAGDSAKPLMLPAHQ